MSITSAIVLFAVLWFLILLMLLPIGVQSQQEAGEIVPGTPPGAPAGAFLAKKLRWTTIIAAIAFGILYGLIAGEVITHEHISAFAPFES